MTQWGVTLKIKIENRKIVVMCCTFLVALFQKNDDTYVQQTCEHIRNSWRVVGLSYFFLSLCFFCRETFDTKHIILEPLDRNLKHESIRQV